MSRLSVKGDPILKRNETEYFGVNHKDYEELVREKDSKSVIEVITPAGSVIGAVTDVHPLDFAGAILAMRLCE